MNPFPSIKRGILAFIGWLRLALCALTTEDGRKGWAMLAALGCSFVMTGIAVWAMWLVQKNPSLAFSLGLAAMAIIIVVITGLMWLLGVRRDTEINLKDGTVKTSDATVGRAAVAPLETSPVEVPMTGEST
jgi:hypothetical protein